MEREREIEELLGRHQWRLKERWEWKEREEEVGGWGWEELLVFFIAATRCADKDSSHVPTRRGIPPVPPVLYKLVLSKPKGS